MQPKLSIIIPCYGVERFLDRCMESIVNQTLWDIEIILVDDKSPDRVPEMCDKWAKKDSRIKVIHKELNEGLGYARNTGLEIAAGEYVAFVDSDDYVTNIMYEKLYTEAKESNADIVFCGFKTENTTGAWTDSNEVTERTEWNGNEIKSFMLDMIACMPKVTAERKYQMSVWHSIYKRSIITENTLRFPSERTVVSEDLPFQINFLQQAKRVVYIPDSFYYYSLNSTSLTASFKPEKYKGFKNLYYLLEKKLSKVEGAHDRLNRFFIGYTRSHILHLARSKETNKKQLLKSICNDDIWHTIKHHFKPYKLPLYPRIIYTLIINKNVSLLLLFCNLTNFIKKRKGLRGG